MRLRYARTKKFIMEMHIDTDEANTANVTTETRARIIR